MTCSFCVSVIVRRVYAICSSNKESKILSVSSGSSKKLNHVDVSVDLFGFVLVSFARINFSRM